MNGHLFRDSQEEVAFLFWILVFEKLYIVRKVAIFKNPVNVNRLTENSGEKPICPLS